MPHFRLDQVFGLKGDGETDDTLPFLDFARKLPPRSTILWPEDFKMRWTDTGVLTGLVNARFVSTQDPRECTPQEPHAGIIYDGRPGNDVLVFDRCIRPYLEGIGISAVPNLSATGGANRCVVLDEISDNGQICSAAQFKRVQVTSGFRNADWIGVANAMRAAQLGRGNCEYHKFGETAFRGGAWAAGGLTRFYGRNPSARDDSIRVDFNSNIAVAAKPGTFRPSDAITQERFRIAVQLPLKPNGTPGDIMKLDTRIFAVLDDQRAQLAAVSPGTSIQTVLSPGVLSFGGYALIGESFGTAFRNAPSFDAKRMQFDDCEIYYCNYGLHSRGGSMHVQQLNCYDNEIDVTVQDNQADASSEFGSTSEQSRLHLWDLSGTTYTLLSPKHLSVGGVQPGGGYFKIGPFGGGDVVVSGGSFDDAMPIGSVCYDLHESTAFLDSHHNTYPPSWSKRDLGWDTWLVPRTDKQLVTVSQIANTCAVRSFGDRANGAGLPLEEWFGGENPTALLRRSGRMNWIQGMAFNPVKGHELRPGEWTVVSLTHGKNNTRQLELLARDWDGELRTAYLPTGKGEKSDE